MIHMCHFEPARKIQTLPESRIPDYFSTKLLSQSNRSLFKNVFWLRLFLSILAYSNSHTVHSPHGKPLILSPHP